MFEILMTHWRFENQRQRAWAAGRSAAGREGSAGGVFTKQSHFAKTNPFSRPRRDGRIRSLVVVVRDPACPSARSTDSTCSTSSRQASSRQASSRQAGSGLRRDRQPPWHWTPLCPRGAGLEYDSNRQESGPACSPDLNHARNSLVNCPCGRDDPTREPRLRRRG